MFMPLTIIVQIEIEQLLDLGPRMHAFQSLIENEIPTQLRHNIQWIQQAREIGKIQEQQ